ncbi:MAG: hypothetical protein LC748_13595, partial [Thermomicrobia bacterium]|nr:hypothetical protein [Thermomicrobia bacterium]
APHTVSSLTGDYLASTDAHSVIMAPPVASNGIPGTFTRSLSVDGISGGVTYTITNLNPHDGHPTTITALSRTNASTGDPDVPLTVTGTGFIPGSAIAYGGVQLDTVFDTATQVHATIPAVLLNYTGTKDVLVINPDPNGGASLPATFTVTPKMALASLSPNDISPGSPQFVLSVTGNNFAPGATVWFNSTALATSYVSPTRLTAVVPASLVTTAGTAQVTVVDAGGVATSAVTLTIAVVNVLPPGQPTVAPVKGPAPLPGGRPTVAAPAGGGTPVPLPPSR